jgi:hypothetical protein
MSAHPCGMLEDDLSAFDGQASTDEGGGDMR